MLFWMSEVCAGPPVTKTGGASSRTRYRAVWHTAQLLVTRGKPTVFFEKPTGISCPGSQVRPSEA